MRVVSAAGSPGVSTSTLGLALAWPRRTIVVEADPTGGSAFLAGFFRGTLVPDGGLIDAAWAYREGRLADALPSLLLPVPDSSVRLLPGVRGHRQAASLPDLWPPLGPALRRLAGPGGDVLVDAGRLGLVHGPEPLIAAADMVVLVVRSDLPAVAGARSWADSLRESRGDGLRLLVVGPGRPYTGREIAKVLGVPVGGEVVWDPAGAAVYSHGATPPRRRTALPRSLRTAAAQLADVSGAASAVLDPTPAGTTAAGVAG